MLAGILAYPFTQESAGGHGHEIVSGETGGRALFFSRLGYGGNRSPEPVEGNAEGARSPVNKSLKKQAREPWNERKGFMVFA